MRFRVPMLMVLTATLLAVGARATAGGKGDAKEEAALMKKAQSFVDAFHKGDAKAVAAHWVADGDYTNQAGKHLKGRAAIEKAFAGLFADNKGLKLRIDIGAVRFVTPDVAIEDGMTSVLAGEDLPPSRARYTIVHVKKDGEWYLSSVRDAPFAPPTHYEHLRELEWLVGSWADEAAKGEVVRVSFDWAENQNFLLSNITTTTKTFAIGGATQRIGWDASAGQLRSWTFVASGGFAEGTWTRKGDQWLIKSSGVRSDGKKVAATNVITRIDADTMSWQARDRSLDGKELPDVPAIRLKRSK